MLFRSGEVRIRNPRDRIFPPVPGLHREVQYFRALLSEVILVALVGPVKRRASCSELQASAIAYFGVLAIENDGDVGIRMCMSGKSRLRLPPLPIWFSHAFNRLFCLSECRDVK